ncbi:hypothetical protein [Nonomuraea terrae]|uniref:hypothetical protein n=1 Tax=Nonomuraea terrae TaxID=2530383 RepID=UPI001CB6C6CF|nr:hypothetical protein [Nonomuraea terrae]
MRGRLGRAAVVCAALGVWWWATVRLAWAGVGCADWGCLLPAVSLLVLLSAAAVAGSAFALERVGVRPGRRVALTAAGTLVVFRLAGESLPSWTSTLADAAACGAAFAGAGALAAFMTEPDVTRGRRIAALAAILALLPAALAFSIARSGL